MIRRLFLFVLFTAFAQSAAATIRLQSGAYYDREKSGTGILADVGPDGSIWGAFFSYTAGERQPTFHTFGGKPIEHQPTSSELPYATLETPLYRSSGGQCLQCEYTAPATFPDTSVGPLKLEVLNARRIRVAVGANTWMMDAMEVSTPAASLPTGRWLMLLQDVVTNRVESISAEVLAEPVELAPFSISGFAAQPLFVPPPQTVHMYEIKCVVSCAGFDRWRSQPQYPIDTKVVWWVDGNTRRSGIDFFTPSAQGNQIRLSANRFEIGLSPDGVRGYPLRYQTLFSSTTPYIEDRAALKLVRLDDPLKLCAAEKCE